MNPPRRAPRGAGGGARPGVAPRGAASEAGAGARGGDGAVVRFVAVACLIVIAVGLVLTVDLGGFEGTASDRLVVGFRGCGADWSDWVVRNGSLEDPGRVTLNGSPPTALTPDRGWPVWPGEGFRVDGAGSPLVVNDSGTHPVPCHADGGG